MHPSANSRRFWESQASTLARRINLATWLERGAPVAFGVAAVFAIALYGVRRSAGSLALAWLAFAGVFLITIAVTAWRTRQSFFRAAEARVLLEAHLRLDTRLTAASAGLVPWPPAPSAPLSIVRWRVRAVGQWLGAGALLLGLAAWAPLPQATAVASAEKPPALAHTDAMLRELEQLKAADPRALEQLQQRAAELARKSAEQQYSHSTLEAADTLRQQTANAISTLGRSLKSAASAAGAKELDKTPGRLAAALSGLREGQLPANANLVPGEADALSNEQMADLQKQLSQLGDAVAGIAGADGKPAEVGQFKVGKGEGGSGEGQGFGAGGEGGGGDTGPLTLNADASNVGPGKVQALSARSPRLALGDKLGTTTGAPESDATASAELGSAGAIAVPAKGGDAVWVDRLTPTERAALKKFFK